MSSWYGSLLHVFNPQLDSLLTVFTLIFAKDTPKNLGIAILCPVSLDDETGPFLHNRNMEQGYYCRPLAEFPAEIGVHLRPSSYSIGMPRHGCSFNYGLL